MSELLNGHKSAERRPVTIERLLLHARTQLGSGDAEATFATLEPLIGGLDVPHYKVRAHQILGEAAMLMGDMQASQHFLWTALLATRDFDSLDTPDTIDVDTTAPLYRASVYCSLAVRSSLQGLECDTEHYLEWAANQLCRAATDEATGVQLVQWVAQRVRNPLFASEAHNPVTELVTPGIPMPSPGAKPARHQGEFDGYSPTLYGSLPIEDVQ